MGRRGHVHGDGGKPLTEVTDGPGGQAGEGLTLTPGMQAHLGEVRLEVFAAQARAGRTDREITRALRNIHMPGDPAVSSRAEKPLLLKGCIAP